MQLPKREAVTSAYTRLRETGTVNGSTLLKSLKSESRRIRDCGKSLRTDDYGFYGHLSLICGAILLIIGIAVPITTTYSYQTFYTTNIVSPFLGEGIAAVFVGIILIDVSLIFYRERNIKSDSQLKAT